MAPKRKPKTVVDLTADDDNEENCHDEPTPKRRRGVSKRQKTPAAASEAQDAFPGGSAGGAGPSTPAPAAAQGGKRKAKEKAEEKENRVDVTGRKVSYRPTASQDVRTRIQRAMPGSAHRMFLVDSRQLSPPGSPGGHSQEFHVLGATGNVYTIRISRSPCCSCPDFAKGHLCKHILFVMLRVLRQRPDNPVIWQRGLLTSEVEEVLGSLAAAAGSGAGAVLDQSVLAAERVRQRYAAITGSGGAGGSGGAAAEAGGAGGAAFGAGVQRPVEGECPICYEDMVAATAGAAGGGRGGEAITFCLSCGNNMHKACFDRWANSKRSGGQSVTCVYCRADWKTAAGGASGDAGAAAAAAGAGEYVNLAQYSDAHRRTASLEQLYGTNAYFIMANNGDMSRRDAVRMHAAARGWL